MLKQRAISENRTLLPLSEWVRSQRLYFCAFYSSTFLWMLTLYTRWGNWNGQLSKRTYKHSFASLHSMIKCVVAAPWAKGQHHRAQNWSLRITTNSDIFKQLRGFFMLSRFFSLSCYDKWTLWAAQRWIRLINQTMVTLLLYGRNDAGHSWFVVQVHRCGGACFCWMWSRLRAFHLAPPIEAI